MKSQRAQGGRGAPASLASREMRRLCPDVRAGRQQATFRMPLRGVHCSLPGFHSCLFFLSVEMQTCDLQVNGLTECLAKIMEGKEKEVA